MENHKVSPSTTISSEWESRALRAEGQVDELVKRVEFLEAQLRLATAKRFGRSREVTPVNQIPLFEDAFNEAEAEADPEVVEPDLETVAISGHKRKKRRSRDDIWIGLPENVIHHTLSPEEMVCSCGHDRHVIRQETTRELRIVPAQVSVDVHVQDICGCRYCEQNGDAESSPMIAAPKPARPLPQSIASPSAIAYMMEQKYVMGVPLYRMEKHFERLDVRISRQNMANWIIACSEQWLEPIYDRMHEFLIEQGIIQADETTLRVLHEPDRSGSGKSYIWLYRSGPYAEPIVLYEYQPSRAQVHPKQFLQGFSGILLTDGYAGYNAVESVIRAGCWSHARRYWDEAVKASGGKSKNPKALEGLAFCNRLFNLERQWKSLSPEERQVQRCLKSKPVLEAFLAWLHTTQDQSLPQSHLGKAITYCLNQWSALNTFLSDGRLPIENNSSERAIKPFVIARKNFLFANTARGAQASAVVFSILETAKEHSLKPFQYMEYLLSELPNAQAKDLDEFLPWSPTLPLECRKRH